MKKTNGNSQKAQRKSHAVTKLPPLVAPNIDPNSVDINRDQWINNTVEGFVSPSAANKEYYRVILELLWPPNHGIPGPHIARSQIREAIDNYRRNKHEGEEPYKPYVDAFRRLRELQGEEGLTGITKQGEKYQLLHTQIGEKRSPRTNLSDTVWHDIVERYDGKCASCGRVFSKYQPDHKIPRLRGGTDNSLNFQPLCDECNNLKSSACRACNLDCLQCCWAYPERYKPIRIHHTDIIHLRQRAKDLGKNAEDLLSDIIKAYLDQSEI